MEIEIVNTLNLGAVKDTEDKTTFQKVYGVVFCRACGKQYTDYEILKNNSICPICGNQKFITGEFAAELAGYLKLNRDDPKALREYYRIRTRTNSRITMNTKRIIIWLLTMDGFIIPGDKRTEDEVRTTLWKKW